MRHNTQPKEKMEHVPKQSKIKPVIFLIRRYELQEADLSSLDEHCAAFYQCCRLFLNSVTPTVWTIGFVVPQHTRQLMSKYGYGLGLATAQGREAKVQEVKKYGHNTLMRVRTLYEQVTIRTIL